MKQYHDWSDSGPNERSKGIKRHAGSSVLLREQICQSYYKQIYNKTTATYHQ